MQSGSQIVTPSVDRYRTKAWERARDAHLRVAAGMARLMREGARCKQIAFQRIMSQYGGKPLGVECKMLNRDSWAFVLPEASGSKPWRVQQFDLDGFIGHLCFDTIPEAVEDMLNMGYRTVDAGALDRTAATSRWDLGIRRAAIMQRHQEGQISYRQMVEELSATV